MYIALCPGKKGGDDMFDKLDTSKLNAHLKELMPGLTAKVFRTYNASITLDDMVRWNLRLLSVKCWIIKRIVDRWLD